MSCLNFPSNFHYELALLLKPIKDWTKKKSNPMKEFGGSINLDLGNK